MRIGQRLKTEKIGTLSHSSGVISLAPSVVNIGGLQVENDALSRTIATDVTLAANTLYMIYMVLNSGVPELRISTNYNSVGPSGFTSWGLVGAFYSNGVTGSIALGSFVNINGSPETDFISYTPTTTNISVGNGNLRFIYRRIGNLIKIKGMVSFGSTTSFTGRIAFSIPSNTSMDVSSGQVVGTNGGIWAYNYSGVATAYDSAAGIREDYSVLQDNNSLTNVYIGGRSTAGSSADFSNTFPKTWVTGDEVQLKYFEAPISGWSNAQIKDL